MRNRRVAVDGKLLDLDSCQELYSDGTFHGSRGVRLLRTEKGTLIWESWTNWQGEDDSYTIISTDEAVAQLAECAHPDRVAEAMEALGVELQEL